MPTPRILLLASALLFTVTAVRAQSPAAAAAYVVADNASGHILESFQPQKKLQIGSLTKVATAMVVLDWSEAKGRDLNELATVPESAGALPASDNAIGLRAGDRASLRDLLYAALLQSDNAAAETLADHVRRSLPGAQQPPVAAFVAQMNALARRLGMMRTRFLNAHGLDTLERSLPYSTAEDLARLARYAMERASFRFFVSQKERKIALQLADGQASSYLLRNTNEALGEDAIDGIKTGTTRRAGPCLMISAAKPPESRQEGEKVIITPRRLNVIVLAAPQRFDFSRTLLARGWQRYDDWAAAGRPIDEGKKRR